MLHHLPYMAIKGYSIQFHNLLGDTFMDGLFAIPGFLGAEGLRGQREL